MRFTKIIHKIRPTKIFTKIFQKMIKKLDSQNYTHKNNSQNETQIKIHKMKLTKMIQKMRHKKNSNDPNQKFESIEICHFCEPIASL